MTHLTDIDHLESHYPAIIRHLLSLGAKFAIIGGVAVSIRTVERFTKELDIAIAVRSDSEAEAIVLSLSRSGYFVETVIEQEAAKRLSTVRLITPGPPEIFIDLLFASSGIESEVVAAAEESEIFVGVTGRVATIPSLIALKVLSANSKTRLQDIMDLQNLIKDASTTELEIARDLMNLITKRGFNRNKNLVSDFQGFLTQFRD